MGSYPPCSRWIIAVFVVLFLLVGFLLYSGHAARTRLEAELTAANKRADLLTAQMEQTNSRVADLKGQLDVTSQMLGLTQEELARARELESSAGQRLSAADWALLWAWSLLTGAPGQGRRLLDELRTEAVAKGG